MNVRLPKWLQGMVGPTLSLWLCSSCFMLVSTLLRDEEGITPRADMVSRMAFPFVIAFWVTWDARKRGRNLCYDYGSFVYFAGWILAPVYLFQTRGVRAFLTLLCFAGIIGVPAIIGTVMFHILEHLDP
jgi:hypothetical protein